MLGKFNVVIKDRHFQEIHHALGCPWPHDVAGKTYRNFFGCEGDSETAGRMRGSPHWSGGCERFGSTSFYVTEEGKAALLEYIEANVDIPALYEITYRHHEGAKIVPARSRSAARYAAYLDADIDWTFMEYAAEIKSVLVYSKARRAAMRDAT